MQCGQQAPSAVRDKPGPAQYCLSSAFRVGLWVVSLATGHSFLGVSILVEEVEAATGLHSVLVFLQRCLLFLSLLKQISLELLLSPSPPPLSLQLKEKPPLNNQHSDGAKLTSWDPSFLHVLISNKSPQSISTSRSQNQSKQDLGVATGFETVGPSSWGGRSHPCSL